MNVLITGATGQLGYDIKKELEQRKITEIYNPTSTQLDITNKDLVDSYIEKIKPDVIFHCAAYTAVDKAEDEIDLCMHINYLGTMNIVSAAKKIDSKLIYISTDYVFDGEKEEGYKTSDLTNPKSVYGLSKLKGEEIVKSYDKSFIVRISWVFGINGNNFVKTMLKLSKTHNELNVIGDQVGSPTYTKDLAKLLVDMSLTAKYGLYHATNEGVCSWYEFAKEILKDEDVTINEVTTKEYQNLLGRKQAIRPKNSKLDKESLTENGFELLPSWTDALERFMEELKNL